MRTQPLIGLAVLVLLGGCGTGGVGAEQQSQRQPAKPQEKPVKVEPMFVESSLKFGLNLLEKLEANRQEPNLFFSPLSASIALTMTLTGAEGETYTEMAKALGYGDVPLERINTENAKLIQILRSPDPQAKVELANSLWVQNQFPLERAFVEGLQRFYDAYAENLDIAGNPNGAVDRVNSWVNEKTHALIPQLFQHGDFTERTRVVLVNTLYFKGKWQKPFDKQATTEHPFRLENGEPKPVPMMFASGKYAYLKGEGFQAVGLPYGKGELVFYLFVPDEGRTLGDLLKQVTPENWKQWLSQFRPAEGDIGLPRFKIESSHPLNEPLQAMGMGRAFEQGRADFRRMSRTYGRELYISKVVQKAVVQVDEEGTEAAAATGVTVGITAMPSNRFSVIADRPFLFAIAHQPTGAVLFMGTVREP